MSNEKLQRLAGKLHIDAFRLHVLGHPLDREKAIRALVARDASLRAERAFVISIVAVLVSLGALAISFFKR